MNDKTSAKKPHQAPKKITSALLNYVAKLQPYDLATRLEQLQLSTQLKLIPQLPSVSAAKALTYLEPELQYNLLQHLPQKTASILLRNIPSDEIVDLLLAVHPLQAEQLLKMLPSNYRHKINELMTYPEDTAGALMTVDYIAARAHWSSVQTINHIRKVYNKTETITYIYATNVRGELVGIISLKELVLAQPNETLSNIITKEVISVSAELNNDSVSQLFIRYGFHALPVVNQQNRLIGIVTYASLLDILNEETTEDFQKVGGSQPLMEPYLKTSIFDLYSKRITWLLILLIGAAFSANVVNNYKDYAHYTLLSIFIAVVTSIGGNTGSQIVTTLIRAIGLGEIEFCNLFKIIKKELVTSLLIGASLSVASALLCQITVTDTYPSNFIYVVPSAAFFVVLWSSIVSAVLPLTLHRLKFDPALISGPLITTFVDGTGVIIYFTIAQVILG
ncbi:MAG: magnesium transporter [Bacillota bacterium]|jgi:magnesium transporter